MGLLLRGDSLFSMIIFFLFLSKKEEKLKQYFSPSSLIRGSLFSMIFSSSFSCPKKRKNIKVFFFSFSEGGFLIFIEIFFFFLLKEGKIKKYSSSSLRGLLYFQLYFLLLPPM